MHSVLLDRICFCIICTLLLCQLSVSRPKTKITPHNVCTVSSFFKGYHGHQEAERQDQEDPPRLHQTEWVLCLDMCWRICMYLKPQQGRGQSTFNHIKKSIVFPQPHSSVQPSSVYANAYANSNGAITLCIQFLGL